MKTINLILFISLFLFGCNMRPKNETVNDNDSEIVNIILDSIFIQDTTLFLVAERPMFYTFDKYDSIYEVSSYGLNFINISNYNNLDMDTTELREIFSNIDSGIHGKWSESVNTIKRISYKDIPTAKKDSVSIINWEETNKELGSGFWVISKPLYIQNKFAFIEMALYTDAEFIPILFLLRREFNEWVIIEYDASYFELIESCIESNTQIFPIHPNCLVCVGSLGNIFDK